MFSGKLVATSFPYLTVHRSIAGDVHIYVKFALKVTHSLRKMATNRSQLMTSPHFKVLRKLRHHFGLNIVSYQPPDRWGVTVTPPWWDLRHFCTVALVFKLLWVPFSPGHTV